MNMSKFVAVFLLVVAATFAQHGPTGVQPPFFNGTASYSESSGLGTTYYFLHSNLRFVKLGNDGSIIGAGMWSYRRLSPERAELTLGTAVRTLIYADPVDKSDHGLIEGEPGNQFTLSGLEITSQVPNLSHRAFVRPGSNVTSGFVVSKSFAHALVRAVGPGLSAFGVGSPLKQTFLRIRDSSGRKLADISGWSNQADVVRQFGEVMGAFPLRDGSNDSAVVVQLDSGAYTIEVGSPDVADSGEVLVEIYLLQ